MNRCSFALGVIVTLVSTAFAQEPQDARWIWAAGTQQPRPEDESVRFRKTFELEGEAKGAVITLAADNHFVLWVNGQQVGRGDAWERASRFDITRLLVADSTNLLAVEAWNDGGPAALIGFLDIELQGGKTQRIDTDSSWLTGTGTEDWTLPEFDASWLPAAEFGRYGEQTWNGVVWYSPPPQVETLPGFRVEEFAYGMGSVIALAQGPSGEMYFSEEGGHLYRLDLDDRGAPSWELVTDTLKNCQGIGWAKGTLWAVGQGPEGTGLYRFDGSSGEVELYGRLNGGGEHGPHAVMEGPDGLLYVMIGNHTKLEETPGEGSPFQISYEGHLLPRYTDPRGHARDIRKPGGLVARLDVETREWEVFGAGFRNAYDMAFNDRGDLFAFDSDMEWDVALPWYRPIRLCHVLPGAEFGWRTGSSKWPEWYADSLPAVVDADRGSPTGVAFYDGHAFPVRFRGAILGCDWSSGTILAFHVKPTGMSYTGTAEVLVRGKPLNVTDILTRPDGSVVFSVGGRGTRGALYRLTYDKPVPPELAIDPVAKPYPMSLFSPETEPAKLIEILGSDDRAARFLAGRTLELRSPITWEREALENESPRVRAEALLALARIDLERGDLAHCRYLVQKAHALWKENPEGDARTTLLRALELLLQDDDAPKPKDLTALGDDLAAAFPTKDRQQDWMLANLIAHLQPEGGVQMLVDALENEPSREEQIHLAYTLRAMDEGWTAETRKRFWIWMQQSSHWRGGMSYEGFLRNIRRDAEARFPADELKALRATIADDAGAGLSVRLTQAGAPVDFDKVLTLLRRAGDAERRSVQEGALVYEKAQCAACHQYGTLGRGIGPELTTLASRFSVSEILESIVDPSRQISDQYQTVTIVTKDDIPYHGMLATEDERGIVLIDSQAKQIEIPLDEIQVREPSNLSLMPKGLLDGLTLEEIADLFTFMKSPPLEAMPTESAWVSLFDGQSLKGWDATSENWSVENGLLVGKAKSLEQSDFLISEGEFGDMIVELDVLLTPGGNSGIQFRSEKTADHQMMGYQADMGQQYWGSLYEQGGRGMLAQGTNEIWRGAVDEAGWNHVVVEAIGERLTIELNGTTITSFRDDRSANGLLGLQLHGGLDMEVRFRNLRVKPIQGAR
ncbi:MAG: DUF1080 domain-containing protein [Planctomycetota bacterium]